MVGGSLRVLWLFPPLKLVAMKYRSWNIAESGVKHQKSNQVKSYKATLIKDHPSY